MEKLKPKSNPVKTFLVFILSIVVLTGWILFLNWLFQRYSDKDYFEWFLKSGTIISIATSFLAIVWQGLEEQKGLLSWHPGYFLSSCFSLLAVFFAVAAANLAGPLDGLKKRAEESVSIIEVLWDAAFALIMHLVMTVFVLGWLLIIAPLFYLVTLITGAPARRSIRDTGIKVIIKEEEFKTTIKEQSTSEKTPDGWINISFGERPFALTNALNAAVLFILEMLITAI